MRNADQWSNLAEMLSNLIAKYADVLDIDKMSEPDMKSNIDKDENDKIILENSVE